MAISVAVCVVLAVFITKTSAKVYSASAIIQVNAPSSQTTDTFQNQQASIALAKTYATPITDRSFIEKIRARVGNGRYTVRRPEAEDQRRREGSAACVTIVLDPILIPTFRVVGAAVASTVAYVWFGTVSLIVLSRIAGIPVRALAIPTRDDLAAYPRAARTLFGRRSPAGGKLAEGERLDVVVAVEPFVVGD